MRTASPRTVIEALRDLALFSRCTDKELKAIARLGTPVKVEASRRLTRPGERGRECFVILSGEATCRVSGRDVATFGPGDFFGEMALLEDKPRSAEVVTVTDVEALVLDRSEFFQLVEASPALSLKMLEAFADRLRQTNGLVDTEGRPSAPAARMQLLDPVGACESE